MGYTSLQLRYVINHIFLPPKLPQEADQTGSLDHIISSIVLDASKPFRSRLDTETNAKWAAVMKMTRDFRDLQTSNELSAKELAKALKELNVGDSLALLIRAQNAGVIIRRDFAEDAGLDEKIIYECFEATAPASSVLSTTGKLVMSFPGPALQLPVEPFDSAHFRAEFASFLAEMNNNLIQDEDSDEDGEGRMRRRKSGLAAANTGETTNPMFITSLLTGIMRGLGGKPEAVTRINKRVGDEVLLRGNGPDKAPWRRSGLWLVLRVALQTTLLREDPENRLYKYFMLFLHGYVLNLALKDKVDSDLLFTMRVKTCRRLAKLGENVPEFLVQYTEKISESVEEELQQRWMKIQTAQIQPTSVCEMPWVPDQLNIPGDTTLRLTNSQARITTAMGYSSMNLAATNFEPHEFHRLREVAHFGDLSAAKLEVAFRTDPFVNLADFEFLVGGGSLASWLENRITPNATPRMQETAASILQGCMRKYESYASSHYKDSPEDQSLMVLTMFELWVAIDKLAVASCPLLGKYSPEVPIDRSLATSESALLRPLLLRKSVDLERLLRVDAYVRSRHERARYKDVSVFSENITSSSFAVKYFDQTRELVTLKAQIERDAQKTRDDRLRELETEMQKRAQIQRRWAREEHDHGEDSLIPNHRVTGKRRKRNVIYTWDCEKCRLQEQIDSFSVSMHEWPLPEDEDEAKRVVFELRPPRPFAQWRAATALLLWNVCTPFDKKKEFYSSQPSIKLSTYEQLSEYMRPGDDELHIMSLASTSSQMKQFSMKKLPATREEICIKSRTTWRLYDPRSAVWVCGSSTSTSGTVFQAADTRKLATLSISSKPSSIYLKANLQFAVSATHHTSNQVIAAQDVCPPQLSLHEYMSFASLRSGARLQWMNLLRELREGTLSWQSEEVGVLVLMLMSQVGCIVEHEGTTSLEWHIELKDLRFGQALLCEMGSLLHRVQGNWKEVVTVRTIILLTSRLLASTPHAVVMMGCYALMREAREVTWEWVAQMEGKLQGCTDEIVKDFQAKVCEMACACRATYDIDIEMNETESEPGTTGKGHLNGLLHSKEDVAIFVACGIIIHDNQPHDLSAETVSQELKRSLRRDHRLAHGIEPTLLRLFSQPVDEDVGDADMGFGRFGVKTIGKEGFDQALKRIWPVYKPAVDWNSLSEPNDRWVTCETAGEGTSRGFQSQIVHLNLLHGKLLVNGRPLGRLPAEFIRHSTYVRVFGKKKVLDVVPAEMPGMQFATRSLLHGYQVMFGMRGENDLVMRAKRDNTVFELIPHSHFRGDLPERFVEDNTHWLNLSNGQIELRPLQSMWDSSPTNWVIHSSQPRRSCTNGSRTLIDIDSWTFQMIAATLGRFEKSQFLTVTCSEDLDPLTLFVELPRFRLSFFRNSSDQLECVNFPGMIIDHDNQSVGAFVGLQNRLLLRANAQTPVGIHRKVLVPFGEISYSSDDENHIEVEVSTEGQRDAHYLDYTIDTSLGCLSGNGSLKSRLYQIYLLALTSHCLPDPLTKHRGTEEALLEFFSAACLSFRELGGEEKALLVKIGKLTAGRFGMPYRDPKSQSITWTSLPPLSHHHGFGLRANEILSCVKQLQVFAEVSNDHSEKKEDLKSSLPSSNSVLDVRGALRTAIFYPEDIKFLKGAQIRDTIYSSRDLELFREKIVCRVASNVYSGESCLLLPKTPALPQLIESTWRTVRAPSEHFRLGYNRVWLSLDMAASWLSIFEKCRSQSMSKEMKRYQLLFSLSAMVFGCEDHSQYVPAIVVAFSDSRLQKPALPQAPGHHFNFMTGTDPTVEEILSQVEKEALPKEGTALWQIPQNEGETQIEYWSRRECQYKHELRRTSIQVANFLYERWSSWKNGRQTLVFPVDGSLFNSADVLAKVSQYYRSCNQNRLLLEHAQGVQSILEQTFQDAVSWNIANYDFLPCSTASEPSSSFVALSDLLQRGPPAFTERDELLWGNLDQFGADATAKISQSTKLASLLADMQRSTLALRKRYAIDLQESHRNLNSPPSRSFGETIPFSIEELEQHKSNCELKCSTSLAAIATTMEPSSASEKAIANAGLWPRISFRALLRQLAYPTNTSLTAEWRAVLLELARDILEYQRSVRLLAYAQQSKREDFFREMDTHVYDVVSATANPDWTLIQIEGNFLARPLQLQVAREMIVPSSNGNTVLQLNMGEGKSSVIVPLVAAALADGNKLVRVVVLKPLAGQMFQLLVERLAGLANRRIFYMPFSRRISVGKEEIALIQRNYEICMKEGGVWIVQPGTSGHTVLCGGSSHSNILQEHILSFKLMSIDRCLISETESDRKAAESLSESQRWLDTHSRDILDESDEILHIRYQLVYTVGQQQPLELHPDRWTIAEELFNFVAKHVVDIKTRNRTGIDIQSSPAGSFTPIRILDDTAGRDLIQEVVGDIFAGRLSSLNIRYLPETMQILARQFITEQKVEESLAEELRQYCGRGNDWKHLLLLRGLIAHGILVYALKDRHYRVDYGLDLSRSLLAVPYRAKDVPSIRAEFGHPDVAVVLTCLTYYYEGLSSAQLQLCFNLLFKLDNPPLEYEAWINNDLSIPVHLRTLNGINTDDADQRTAHIIPLFGRRKTVIDFYLSHVVFPKAAKEFPHKLSSSGWDLAETKPGHVTTGFSGTNDNRFLLPTSISQQDPLQQNGTNAKVLNYLLQEENDTYRCAAEEDGGHMPVKRFLEFLTHETLDMPVQLLLDVGAQMLDLKNHLLAREWLKLRPDKAAAIFFNEKDDMMVVSQDGTAELLLSSPFKGQLNQCLVYLDDAHTRGTDLKMPIDARAAVTLGPKVTKDRLIQGCMRMRKLGFGQSIIFFAPSEIDRAIRDMRKSGSKTANIHTVDILRWAMYETCKDIAHHVPHWAEQGWDYLRRKRAWEEFIQEAAAVQTSDEVKNPDIDTLKKVWMREEARSLENMYRCQTGPASTGVGGGDLNMRESILATPELRERLQMLGVKELEEVNMDEEQEREVSHEIERETHIERPPRVTPANHEVTNGIREFIRSGELSDNQDSEFRKTFIRMFRSIEGTVKKSPLNGEEVWSPGLYVTIDFANTISVKDARERGSADYLRPLNWLLTSRRYATNNVIIGLSSFEVNELLPEIRKSKVVNLHVYAPRVTKDMLPLDDLKFYAVPAMTNNWIDPYTKIISQLNLFAGQLYFGNYDIYRQLCQFLGLDSGEKRTLPEPMQVDDEPYPIQSDGFVRPGKHRELMNMHTCRFLESPVPFLQELIGLRRKGTGYLPTHMGRIVHGRLLKPDDFDY